VSNRIKSVVALSASVALVWITYSPIRAAYVKEKTKATSGDLVAKDDGKDHSSEFPTLEGGSGPTFLHYKVPPTGHTIVTPYDNIDLKMVNGRVQLSTTVRDDNQNLIVEIKNNHWTISSSTAVCWDKNYTDDSLEVKDGHGRVVLQVKLLPTIVQLQEEWQWGPGTKPTAFFEEGKYDQKNGIKPMFKYPSELYWGELEPGPY